MRGLLEKDRILFPIVFKESICFVNILTTITNTIIIEDLRVDGARVGLLPFVGGVVPAATVATRVEQKDSFASKMLQKTIV